jgi:hypothetical protein
MEKLKGTGTKIHDDDRSSYAIHIISVVNVQFLVFPMCTETKDDWSKDEFLKSIC